MKNKVSIFDSYTDSAPKGVVSLNEWLLSSKYKKKVTEVRGCADKDKRRSLKSKLPAITPSGIFEKRCSSGLKQHSGFICIDIDGKDNPDISDWEALKDSISDLDSLYYAGLSASGNGLYLLFRIRHTDKHSEHFNALSRDLKERGITIDEACKDVARLRGASYDPAPFFNPDPTPYAGLLEVTKELRPQQNAAQPEGITACRVGKLVADIERAGTNIADYYPVWFAIGQALANEFGEYGRGWFHIVSRQSGKYKEGECDSKYDECLKGNDKITIGTFFFHCKNNGLTTIRHGN